MDTRKNLHRARVARNMDLGRVSAITALSPAIVRKIDDGRYEELPGGLYARSYVRAFAEAVGLSPEAALQDVEELLPRAPDPLPTLRGKTGPSLVAGIRTQLTSLIARVGKAGVPRSVSMRAGLPLTMRKGLAALLDALVLVGIGATTTMLTAWLCGVGFVAVIEQAGFSLALMLSGPILVYFVLFQGVGGQTPGGRACGLPRSAESRELRLQLIASRVFRTN